MRVRTPGWFGLLLAGMVCIAAMPAWAGRNCEKPTPLKTQALERGLSLAQRTLAALDGSGAEVVILARAGQDLSKYGVHYSHLGFAYRQSLEGGGYVWRVLHKLNQCGSAESALYKQGLGDFFLDDLWRYEAAWVVPSPALQSQLKQILQDPVQSIALHHKPYSLVSYVWGKKYQQSNQWALETMAMAMGASKQTGATARDQAQAWLRNHAYQPSVLKINALTRLGARISATNVAFDDHPNEQRFADKIATVTVDSVFDWMVRTQRTTQPVHTLE